MELLVLILTLVAIAIVSLYVLFGVRKTNKPTTSNGDSRNKEPNAELKDHQETSTKNDESTMPNEDSGVQDTPRKPNDGSMNQGESQMPNSESGDQDPPREPNDNSMNPSSELNNNSRNQEETTDLKNKSIIRIKSQIPKDESRNDDNLKRPTVQRDESRTQYQHTKPDDGEVAAIVIDNGSALIIAGFAGNGEPNSVFPTLIGKPKDMLMV